MHLGAAIKWFFKVLGEGEPILAQAASAAKMGTAEAPAISAAPPPPAFTPSREPAIQLLGLLQKEGRLIDFLMEDVGGFSDAEIGAAVRDIHAGCRRALLEHATLKPVLAESEDSPVTVAEGFDASAILLTGEVSGRPPYKGFVRHRGWRVADLRLPTVPQKADASIAAPAEVEVR